MHQVERKQINICLSRKDSHCQDNKVHPSPSQESKLVPTAISPVDRDLLVCGGTRAQGTEQRAIWWKSLG